MADAGITDESLRAMDMLEGMYYIRSAIPLDYSVSGGLVGYTICQNNNEYAGDTGHNIPEKFIYCSPL